MPIALESRLLVFGLLASDSAADVMVLLGSCGQARLDICQAPGSSGQAFAVVHLQPDAALAMRVAGRVKTRRLHGRRLQTWVPAMPWA